jgi:hypothetical protein
VEERLFLRELNHLYERLSAEERDELLQCLLIAAPRGGEAMIKVLQETLLCHAVDELLDDSVGAGGVLVQLARLLRKRNIIEREIAQLIGRPAERGHIGEFIASRVFDIELHQSASHKATDGFFRSGPFAGRSVNIKCYGRQEGILDVSRDASLDYYLVLTGPPGAAASSRSATRPWVIDRVCLFDQRNLLALLDERGAKVGVATSIPKSLWEAAEIYPSHRNQELSLSPEQAALLGAFSSELAG